MAGNRLAALTLEPFHGCFGFFFVDGSVAVRIDDIKESLYLLGGFRFLHFAVAIGIVLIDQGDEIETAPQKECPECHSPCNIAARECPECGHEFEFDDTPKHFARGYMPPEYN